MQYLNECAEIDTGSDSSAEIDRHCWCCLRHTESPNSKSDHKMSNFSSFFLSTTGSIRGSTWSCRGEGSSTKWVRNDKNTILCIFWLVYSVTAKHHVVCSALMTAISEQYMSLIGRLPLSFFFFFTMYQCFIDIENPNFDPNMVVKSDSLPTFEGNLLSDVWGVSSFLVIAVNPTRNG